MDIKPGKQGYFRDTASVTFDTAREFEKFSFHAPYFSREHHRGQPIASILIPAPETFPAEIDVPERVIERVAGKLILLGVLRPSREEIAVSEFNRLRTSMARTIIEYFSRPYEDDKEGLNPPTT